MPCRFCLALILFSCFALTANSQPAGGRIRPTQLRCEYLVDPLAVDVERPRLSWILDAGDLRDVKQTAFQIIAASSRLLLISDRGDLWDSGRISSSQSAQVEYAGKLPSVHGQLFWKVRVWDQTGRSSGWSQVASWGVGPGLRGALVARWIGDRKPSRETVPATLLRHEFDLPARPTRAVVYASALGAYELRINGQRVGDHYLAPEFTDYHLRVQYQAYDVTRLLRPGRNAIGGILGDGWYAGGIGLAEILIKQARNIYGDHPRLFVQLDLDLPGGRSRRVVSDGTWRTSRDGPIISSDLLDGEHYDARREMTGWDAPGFNDKDWSAADVRERVEAALVAQPNEPIRVTREIKPITVTEPKTGTYVFDMGQNMVGWCRLKSSGSPGDVIRLRFAEMLNDDGSIYTENLRGAKQLDSYIFKGSGVEEFEPHFTYHGFRYVEVTGLRSRPALDAITGRQLNSSMTEVGTFETSSQLLNRLWENVLWTQRDNMIGIPTDCPQRDERLGWTGDIQVFVGTSIFNMDMGAFFTKWLQDLRDDQTPDGRFPDFAPQPFQKRLAEMKRGEFMGVPGWGDAGVVVPWRLWQQYGDKRALADNFEPAKRWVEFIRSNNPDLLWKNKRHNDYGDWLNSDTMRHESIPRKGGEVPKPVFATMMFAHAADLVSRMAQVLGKTDDEKKYSVLFRDIRSAFNKAYVKDDGRMEGNTQSGYALALHFNLLPEAKRSKAVQYMIEGIRAYGGHMSTGFHSTYRMMLELTRSGHSDVAYSLINQRSFPSWGYSIENGATTIWERWDGYVKGRGFQDKGMNSFNHYAIGAVAEWMYRVILGINNDDEHPGYERFTVHPVPGGGLTWAKGGYRSIRGPIDVSWRDAVDSFTLEVAIPANSTATIVLPLKGKGALYESGRPFQKGLDAARVSAGEVSVEVGSGRYRFEVR